MTLDDMRCESCGRFMRYDQPGSSWADQFEFHPPACVDTLMRCRACTERLGRIRTNARGCVESYEGVRT